MTSFSYQRLALSTEVDLDVWTAGTPSNPPLIFLHGFPESHRTWRHQIAALSDRYYCIAPDQRGYAKSSKPTDVSDYAVPKLIADIFALANALDIDRFTLVAHDWGGAIGWATALVDQHRVERLIICNAPHPHLFQLRIYDDMEQRHASQYIRNFRDEGFVQAIEQKGAEWFFDTSFMRHLDEDKVSADDRAAYLEEWSQPGALRAMLNWYRASPIVVPTLTDAVEPSALLDQTFPKLTVPTLVIWGMEDKALRPSVLDNLGDYVDDLTIIRVEGAGHFVPWEAPDAVSDAIAGWMG